MSIRRIRLFTRNVKVQPLCTNIRNKILTERCLPQVSVLRYEDKIKFKSFFAFVVLYFMAWFNRLGLLNLGQFWPLFVVEWRIFTSHKTRRIYAPKNVKVSALESQQDHKSCSSSSSCACLYYEVGRSVS